MTTDEQKNAASRSEAKLAHAKGKLTLRPKPVEGVDEADVVMDDVPEDPCEQPATCAKAGWLRPTQRALKLISRPRVGQYYWVDFPVDTAPPEFISRHPAVVVRAAASLSEPCVIVPITSTEPEEKKPYHYELTTNPNPYKPKLRVWAICNHLYTVHLNRLNPIHFQGALRFPRVSDKDKAGIFDAVVEAFPFLSTQAEDVGANQLK